MGTNKSEQSKRGENYQSQLERVLKDITSRCRTEASRPRLLLHACCAPCSSYVLETLAKYFSITILYYNPNIYPAEEYRRRLGELEAFLPRFMPGSVKLIEDDYNPAQFYAATGVAENPELADESERGERCRRCYRLRLERAYRCAKEGLFDWFCTTLSISPFKDAGMINQIGEELSADGEKPFWLPSDFKKRGGFLRSLELSREYGLYRQEYCGCEYSARAKKLREKLRDEKGRGAESSAL